MEEFDQNFGEFGLSDPKIREICPELGRVWALGPQYLGNPPKTGKTFPKLVRIWVQCWVSEQKTSQNWENPPKTKKTLPKIGKTLPELGNPSLVLLQRGKDTGLGPQDPSVPLGTPKVPPRPRWHLLGSLGRPLGGVPGLAKAVRAGSGQEPLLTTCFCCRWVRSCWEVVPGLEAAYLLQRCGATGTPVGAKCMCVQSNKVYLC